MSHQCPAMSGERTNWRAKSVSEQWGAGSC